MSTTTCSPVSPSTQYQLTKCGNIECDILQRVQESFREVSNEMNAKKCREEKKKFIFWEQMSGHSPYMYTVYPYTSDSDLKSMFFNFLNGKLLILPNESLQNVINTHLKEELLF